MKLAIWLAVAALGTACGTTPIKVAGEIAGEGDAGTLIAQDGGPSPTQDGGPVTADGGPLPPAQDAGPTTPMGGVVCGQGLCDATREDCCVSRGQQTCGARGSCPGTTLSCSGAASCPMGQQCCLSAA